ncbi:hypothetical protein V6Z11_D01G153700 [Gossypium hirsutum]
MAKKEKKELGTLISDIVPFVRFNCSRMNSSTTSIETLSVTTENLAIDEKLEAEKLKKSSSSCKIKFTKINRTFKIIRDIKEQQALFILFKAPVSSTYANKGTGI